MPMSRRESLIFPLYKKEEKTTCPNYRPIALLDVVYKVVVVTIKSRLKKNRVNSGKISRWIEKIGQI